VFTVTAVAFLVFAMIVYRRPSKRFLYFRFIMTYLNAKRASHDSFTKRAEHRTNFFAS
jgi:hypothetical protein